MIHATFEQVDNMYHLNSHFRDTITFSYYGWYGHGADCRNDTEFMYIHAKNTRFELVVCTSLFDEWDDFNHLILDGRRYLLNEFETWEQVEAEINKRL